MNNKTTQLFSEFNRIFSEENRLFGNKWIICELKPDFIYYQVISIIETCKISFLSRSYNVPYHLTEDKEVCESVGAHTNFACEILKHFLIYNYDADAYILERGYTYNEAMDAMSRHDKPEAKFGDKPDNGSRDEEQKVQDEHKYQEWLSSLMPISQVEYEKNVRNLICEMDLKSTFLGRSLYLSDKISALLVNLYLDSVGRTPYRTSLDDGLSARDKEEIDIIARQYGIDDLSYHYKGSEMWAIDYLEYRKIAKYDDSGYFTALFIMYTLVVNGKWYDWREQQYEPPKN